uniref:Phospholipase B-like n=1 Tax=Zooxanthella nutricula TaxID=1333877 RepID=A0A6U9RAD3_9DINO|mmetsp:Transcript_17478/g.52177  ORF Transcript_17478/g.52177 Transcript_17478/m.52177 type:complete len:246 (+) Transcript_17478:73-810(+)
MARRLAALALLWVCARGLKTWAEWPCPVGLDERVCRKLQHGVTNCALVAQALNLTKASTEEIEVAVAGADVDLAKKFSAPWTLVYTRMAHEYVVQRVSADGTDPTFRVYQANSEGPLDVREWLGDRLTSEEFGGQWLDGYAKGLHAFTQNPDVFEVRFHPLPAGHELQDWWGSLMKNAQPDKASEDQSVEQIVQGYRQTWQRFGRSQVLSLAEFQSFLQTPVLIGGGSSPRQGVFGLSVGVMPLK